MTHTGRQALRFCCRLAVCAAAVPSPFDADAIAQDAQEKVAWSQVYRRAEAWPKTMLLARARYRMWRASKLEGRPFNAVDLAMRRIRIAGSNFATYEHRMPRDLKELRLADPRTKGDRPATALDWFNSTGTEIDRGLIRIVLDRMEIDCAVAKLVTAPFRARLAKTERERVAPDDVRWLQLYCTVTDWEHDLKPIRRLDTLGESAEVVARRFGDECTCPPADLLDDLARLHTRWGRLREPLLHDPDQARPQAVELVGEYAKLRDRLRFGLRPVGEFLASCPSLNMKTEWEEQLTNVYAELQRLDWYHKPAVKRQAARKAALILDSDRDPTDVVLRRTRALLGELLGKRGANRARLAADAARLSHIDQIALAVPVRLVDARHALFFEASRVRRDVALSNPLLDFDRVLFVKRHFLRWGTGPAQKQYQGHRTHGGGALCVLEQPFGNAPRLTNLLADSICQRGRMKGRRLERGDFACQELSYDGKTILFAYTENSQAAGPAQFIDTKRTLKNTYHVFKVDADGRNLVQLTDGPFNDVDPCFLPNGRIAFISERRGGCGRSAADRNYTLHGMAADGSNMVRLSHHETNEWQPSVDHHGMILYTRWDIWDRGYFQAMNVWQTYPNGSDGRAIFGNYYEGAQPCPNATMDVRAIPGSHKLIGTATSYFEQSYGALIVIDPSIPDDPEMTKLKRITPDQPFAWREMSRYTGPLDYGTPWPLNELFCLCVYDSDSAIRRGPKNNYGMYLVDAFGNKELLYRAPEISCLSPIPLRARPKPPIAHRQATEAVRAGDMTPSRGPDAVPMATVGVLDVYRSYYPIPASARIKELRIIQVAYKGVVGRNIPVTGYGEGHGHDKGGRMVLGTVPVEDDGSAYFRMPAGVPIAFQAVADDGLAVQAMRSVTYAQPGERLLCIGCHEPQSAAPGHGKLLPKAFRREPSPIVPDVDGSNPVSFPLLVQPILDRRCVGCHQDNLDKAPSLARGDRWRRSGTTYYDDAKAKYTPSIPPKRLREEGHKYAWYDSYINLYPFVREASFVMHGPQDGAQTKPGTFGARVAKLYQMLKKGHNDVQLSDAEMHRIALWIDMNCRFFGPTRNLMAQAMGKRVRPEIE